ncbi:peptidoglycan DD-metalloendopeptidase family protein [Enterovibrio paralichthyis]|uniref:peptidoglycan DD-metalloendopeptidase family protein n=1 Tax=Enterovibrio paralichthyis TaxID=2853805 RepID=UPI001C43ECBC|nr:peptidoglycan DD-metalloendopeptidase family protein [Enterovibrio paralichthyis]MBV7299012.1 peptidoglycan DD-metalloendopeptidase family protein [Enterovibrio paralichthyis]
MPQNIRIAVSHANGSRHFVLSPSLKKILLSLLATLIIGIFASIATIYYLNHRSTAAEDTLKSMTEKSSALVGQLEDLKQKRQQLEQLISNKEEEYAQIIEDKDSQLNYLTQRVSTVEEVLGLEKDAENAVPLSERLDVAAINSAVRATMLQLIPSGKPIESYRRSSGYGSRTHPVTGNKKFHLGLDLTADIGTPVYAPADGVVEYKRPSKKKGYGNLLKIDHAFGFMTLYAHLDKFNVNTGQFVKKGDLIGWSGNTGLSTGPHLHYEVRFLGRALNPKRFIAWTPDNFESLFKEEDKVKWASLVKIVEGMVATQVQLASEVVSQPGHVTAKATAVVDAKASEKDASTQ